MRLLSGIASSKRVLPRFQLTQARTALSLT